MKQVLIKNGVARLEEVPTSSPGKNEVLVQVNFSCISPGTERKKMLDSRTGSLIDSVVQKPERVKKAYRMMRSEGVRATVAKAKGHLRLGDPSGYSLSGIVREIGENVKGFVIGDQVACAGAENAFHAEYVCVPSLLTVPVPDGVHMQQAATVALGAISLQGMHRCNATIGEYVAVIGLGALGLITGLLLIKAGCHILGFDLNQGRIELAKLLGFEIVINPSVESPERRIDLFTKGYGVDAVVITAASSDSVPVELAASICRKKGKVVVVGNTELTLDRNTWYPKEMDLLISTSYGPGRYDPKYETEGQDYPYAYVRWTENRNMVAYLECLQSGLDISPLIRKSYPITEVEKAFQSLIDDSSPAPLVLLQYEPSNKMETCIEIAQTHHFIKDRINVAVIGPGDFARSIHLPNLKKLRNLYQIYAIMGKHGYKAKEVALRYGAQYATTNYGEILQDENVDLVFITTRHDLHAPLAISAAQAGKAIFLEKPMALSREQLAELEQVLRQTKVPFVVGFNRRFSPLITSLKDYLVQRTGPLMAHFRVNSQELPVGHWVHSAEGGGQLIGEGCHFIDLLNFLVGKDVESFSAFATHSQQENSPIESNFQVTLRYEDGSLANLLYTTLGNKELPKEYLEAFFDHEIIVMDNFRDLKSYDSSLKPMHFKQEQKGHLEELQELARFLKGNGNPPIQLKEMLANTLITLEITERLRGKEGKQNAA